MKDAKMNESEQPLNVRDINDVQTDRMYDMIEVTEGTQAECKKLVGYVDVNQEGTARLVSPSGMCTACMLHRARLISIRSDGVMISGFAKCGKTHRLKTLFLKYVHMAIKESPAADGTTSGAETDGGDSS